MFHHNQLVGRYRIKKSVGSGGFGAVFLAEDGWLGKDVALKVPHQQTAGLDDLLAEARVLAGLDHPNILRIHTVEHLEGVFFLVMEYVEGESLADRIDREGPLKPADFLGYIEPVLLAVAHAHERNIVHRDLRPANILIGRDGRVKVADFGISKLLRKNGHAITRIGSPPYMAPEQFSGRTVLQSDIYALGVIMYEMLTAVLPIAEVQAERVRARQREGGIVAPRSRNPAVSEALNEVVLRALEFEVAARWPSVGELHQALLCRPAAAQGEGLREIRERLKVEARDSTSRLCWNCHRPLARRTPHCAHCGEAQ